MDKKLQISLGVLFFLVCFYFYDNSKQQGYQDNYASIFDFDHSKIVKVIILKNNDGIELEKIDSKWQINGHDSLVVKENSINTLFDKTLQVKNNTLAVSNNPQDLSMYSLNDSLGINFILFDQEGNTLSNVVFGISPSNYYSNYYKSHEDKKVYKTDSNILTYLTTSPKYWGEIPVINVPDTTQIPSIDVPDSLESL